MQSLAICDVEVAAIRVTKMMDFPVTFYQKDLKQNCEHAINIENKLTQNPEQTEL